MKMSIEERDRLREIFKKFQAASPTEKEAMYDIWHEALTKAKASKSSKKPDKLPKKNG